MSATGIKLPHAGHPNVNLEQVLMPEMEAGDVVIGRGNCGLSCNDASALPSSIQASKHSTVLSQNLLRRRARLFVDFFLSCQLRRAYFRLRAARLEADLRLTCQPGETDFCFRFHRGEAVFRLRFGCFAVAFRLRCDRWEADFRLRFKRLDAERPFRFFFETLCGLPLHPPVSLIAVRLRPYFSTRP